MMGGMIALVIPLFYRRLKMTIHEYCKYYRTFILKITLKELVERVKEQTGEDIKVSSVSSFENGRSTNIKYIMFYLSISTEEQTDYFTNNLKRLVKEGNYGRI